MLDKLIHEIQSGGTLEPVLLSSRLDTSPQLVRAMLDHLERLGVLQNLSKCVDSGCGICSLSSSCHDQGGVLPSLWKINTQNFT